MMKSIEFLTQNDFKHRYKKSTDCIYHGNAQTDFGLVVYLLLDDKICALGFGFDKSGNKQNADMLLQKMQNSYWVLKRLPLKKMKQPRNIQQDIEQFFASKGKITPPILAIGTEKQILGWKNMLCVPYGTNDWTYGDLAEKVNSHARQVATNVVAKNPIALFLPCHRIIGKNGSQKYAYGTDCKIKLQQAELNEMQTY